MKETEIVTEPFGQLLIELINAAFDCGAWEHDDDDPAEEPYEVVLARSQKVQSQLADAHDALVAQVERLKGQVASLRAECEARVSQLNIARSNWDSCQGKLGNIERVLNEYRNEETDIITNIEEWNVEFATITRERDEARKALGECDKALTNSGAYNLELQFQLEALNGRQVAWVIEFPPDERGILYWGWASGATEYLATTPDNEKALRFSRMEDAAAVIRFEAAFYPFFQKARPVEHMWCLATQKESE